MNTRQLRYLAAIAEFGTLSQAARILGISQPALSRILAEWEDQCGQPLFLRSRGKLHPTAAGTLAITSAQKILDEQNSMMLAIRTVTGSDKHTIRVCTAPYRAAILYSKIFKPFSRSFPDIALDLTELHSRRQPEAILSGQVDIAIGAGFPMPDQAPLCDIPFAMEELLICLPVSHPLASKNAIHLSELKDTPFVLQSRKHNIRFIADRLFEEAGFYPVVSFESDDVLLLEAMMRQGIGAGFVSKIHVTPCEEVVYLPLDPPFYQTQNIRFPAGHTLQESEAYLVGLMIHERLQDDRYIPVQSRQTENLFHMAQMAEAAHAPEAAATFSSGSAQKPVRSVNFNLKVLEYIVSILDEHSLAKAADRWYLAQSALSRHLKNTEEIVGLPLFSRRHNRLTPTKAGAVFINGARNMLRIYDEMQKKLQNFQKGYGDVFILQCDPFFMSTLIPAIMEKLNEREPDLPIVPQAGDHLNAEDALLNASASLALILCFARKHPALSYVVLSATEMLYVPDRDNPLPDSAPGTPLGRHLTGRKLLLGPESSALCTAQTRLAKHLYTDEPYIACHADSIILRTLAETGGGDTILPACFLSEEIQKRSHPFHDSQPLYLILAHNPSVAMPPGVRLLADIIREYLRSVPYMHT